jgi:hypothetical protein
MGVSLDKDATIRIRNLSSGVFGKKEISSKN